MPYKVIDVIDGDTFQVSPEWTRDGKSGDRVRIANYNTPEKNQYGYEEAKRKLRDLIFKKNVELGPTKDFSYGRLVCDVYLNGKSITAYFPEYKG